MNTAPLTSVPTASSLPEIQISLIKGKPTVTSLQVAEAFGKRHDHVLRDIKNLLTQVSETFREPNFVEYVWEQKAGFGTRKNTAYLLTRDGFLLPRLFPTPPYLPPKRVSRIFRPVVHEHEKNASEAILVALNGL